MFVCVMTYACLLACEYMFCLRFSACMGMCSCFYESIYWDWGYSSVGAVLASLHLDLIPNSV